MTFVSTLLAPLLTPFAMQVYIGRKVEIDFLGMFFSLCLIVIVPVLSGLLIRRFFRERLSGVLNAFPSISILTIAFVIAVVMALNSKNVMQFPVLIILAVMLHNLGGFSAGYAIGRIFSKNKKDCRTVAIEVGMQNSGLAVALASKFFCAKAALPGALFSLWHNLSGIALAKYWALKESKTKK
jgi:BASS family bile acid:Na+ symporter